jgi:hypothetical protein
MNRDKPAVLTVTLVTEDPAENPAEPVEAFALFNTMTAQMCGKLQQTRE